MIMCVKTVASHLGSSLFFCMWRSLHSYICKVMHVYIYVHGIYLNLFFEAESVELYALREHQAILLFSFVMKSLCMMLRGQGVDCVIMSMYMQRT